MQLLYSLCVLFSVSAISKAAEVRLLDLDPQDAQQIIDKQDTSLNYAPKIDTNVPAVRYLGNEPHNVLEDIYLANQYHGQDGIGGYLYGYSVPDIAKTERKRPSGDLKGAYNYIAGNGQEIKVEYWDDGTGFHQVDNVPKILPKQIDDTPEVKAAKEEHARIWREQAERNSHPIQNPYDNHATPFSAQGQFQGQQFAQQPQYHGQPQGQYQGQPQGQNQGQYQGQYGQPQAQFASGPQQQAGQYNQPQQSQNGNQYQQKAQLAQTQDQNDIYSGQYSETRNSYAQNKPVQGQNQQGQYQQGQQAQHQQGQYQQGQQAQHQQGQYQQGQQAQHQGQYQQGQQAQYQQDHYNQGQHNQGQYNQGQYNQGQYNQGQYNQGQQQGKYQEGEEEEVTGPPKGFFYSFDYPVGIIVSKDGGSIQKREGDLKNVYAENKATFEAQLKGASGHGGSYLVQQ